MTSTQKYLSEGKDTGIKRIHVSLDITSTSLSNVSVSGYTAFTRAFDGIPKVLGTNCDAFGVISVAVPTSIGISLYGTGYKDGLKPDGTLVITATLEGRLI
jgi:hypothetical protein